MNNIAKNGSKLISIILLLAAASSAGWLSRVLCGDGLSFYINAACITLMTLLILWSFLYKAGIFALENVSYALQEASNISGYKSEHLRQKVEDTLWRDERFLRPALQQYRQEQQNSAEFVQKFLGSYRNCDISDYFNDSLLDSASNSSYNDLVGGMMTGLGILGTFIGLIMGLKQIGTSPEDVMNSIGPLINGMKVAFLTSVFGIIASLAFNCYYHYCRGKAERALEQFLQSYYTYVEPRVDNEMSGMLLLYQRHQTELMENFASTVAKELSENVAKVLPDAINSAVIPQLKELIDQSEKATDKLSEQQVKSVDRIASKFVGQMNKMLGNQFGELGRTVKELNNTQKETRSQLNDTSANLERASIAFENYLNKLKSVQQESSIQLHNIQQETSKLIAKMDQTLSRFEKTERALSDIIHELDNTKKMQIELSNFMNLERAELEKAVQQQSNSLNKQEIEISRRMSEEGIALANLLRSIDAKVGKESESRIEKMVQMQSEFASGIQQSETQITAAAEMIHEAARRLSTAALQGTQTSDEIKENFAAVENDIRKASEELAKVVSQLESMSTAAAPWWARIGR